MCSHEVVRFAWRSLRCIDCDRPVPMMTGDELRDRADKMDRDGRPGAARRLRETARHVEENVRLGLVTV